METTLSTIGMVNYAISGMLVNIKFDIFFSKYPHLPAELVFTNGKIYTVNEAQPWAEAIAIKGNEIFYVGDDAGAKAFIGDKTLVEDVGGKFMMPGIIATHEHSIIRLNFPSDSSWVLTHV